MNALLHRSQASTPKSPDVPGLLNCIYPFGIYHVPKCAKDIVIISIVVSMAKSHRKIMLFGYPYMELHEYKDLKTKGMPN